MGSDALPKKLSLKAAQEWVKSKPPKVQAALAGGAALLALVLIYLLVEDHDNLFVLAEAVHFVGIGCLVYKLSKEETCSGLSRKTQHLTLVFLTIRLYCSFMMEYDIHTVLDLLTLVATGWVVFTMHTKLASTYQAELDTVPYAFVLAPCFVLALVAHPTTNHWWLNRLLWAAQVYVESVSVAPQLRMMQRAVVVERHTANYVFALGVARFLACAHWVLQVLDGESFLLTSLGSGIWPPMVLLSEIVQTGILADFCYYYVKTFAEGGSVMRLPTGTV